MYRVPKDLDLSFLKGRRLDLICFAAYQINLHFDDAIVITVLGPFQHIVAEQETRVDDLVFPLSDSKLLRLLTHEVKEVTLLCEGTLRLAFSNGDILTVRGDSGPYESYHVKHGDRLIIV